VKRVTMHPLHAVHSGAPNGWECGRAYGDRAGVQAAIRTERGGEFYADMPTQGGVDLFEENDISLRTITADQPVDDIRGFSGWQPTSIRVDGKHLGCDRAGRIAEGNDCVQPGAGEGGSAISST
jgi:hypothetical protein